MMESPILPRAGNSVSDPAALRVPEWAELAARFGAARDLRTALRGGYDRSGGSFNRFIAAVPPTLNGEADTVNLTGLEHGKASPGIVAVPEVDSLLQADRETP